MSNVLAVGDIHTESQVIKMVRKVIHRYDKVVFCGDYADDFSADPEDTIAIWKLLQSLQRTYPNKVSPVIGNHDYLYVHNAPSLQSGYNPATQTLLDAPENKDLREWLLQMPVIIEIDGVTYSHAGITNEWAATQDTSIEGLWNDTSPIWTRPYNGTTYKHVPQVFGHTPMETCEEIEPNIWCIDTFSTWPDGRSYGDNSVLEVTDGTVFSKVYLH